MSKKRSTSRRGGGKTPPRKAAAAKQPANKEAAKGKTKSGGKSKARGGAKTAQKGAGGRASGVKLPSSGLAAEILASLDEPPAETDQEKVFETPDGPDRIFRFADELGRRSAHETAPEEPLETWVSFRLREEVFGFPVSNVHEVTRVETLTRVPHAPFPVRGITTLRGQILPVVDLRRRLGLGETEILPESRILVVSSRDRRLGLLVERVEQVVHIARSGVEPAPEDVLTEQSDYILGVYELGPGLMILLELDTVMLVRDPDQIERKDEPGGRGKQ